MATQRRHLSPFVPTLARDTQAAWRRLLQLAGTAEPPDIRALTDLRQAEWEDLLAEAELHWLSPELYRMLAPQRAALAIPAMVWRRLKLMYRLSRGRARHTLSLVEPVLRDLGAAGIPMIALKGLHLAWSVYPEPAARPMLDIDLLVKPEDLERAARIVEAHGFHQDAPSALAQPARLDTHHPPPFRHPHGPPIELHHALEVPDWRQDIDLEEIWARARPTRLGGAKVLALAPEDALLHLCLHAVHHHLFGVKLLSLRDIPVALDHWGDQIDWEAFWRRARAWGAERSALLTLAFTRQRLGHPLPKGAARPLEAHDLDALLDIAERQMRHKAAALAERRQPTDAPPPAEIGIVQNLWRLPSRRQRVAHVFKRLFPSRQELAAHFGLSPRSPWIFPLQLLRIGRLATRIGWGWARNAQGRLHKPQAKQRKESAFETVAGQKRLISWLNGG